jgi:hypothetical protein
LTEQSSFAEEEDIPQVPANDVLCAAASYLTLNYSNNIALESCQSYALVLSDLFVECSYDALLVGANVIQTLS